MAPGVNNFGLSPSGCLSMGYQAPLKKGGLLGSQREGGIWRLLVHAD